jgi:hypothetical protein
MSASPTPAAIDDPDDARGVRDGDIDAVVVTGSRVLDHVGAGLRQRDLDVADDVGLRTDLLQRLRADVPHDRDAGLVPR